MMLNVITKLFWNNIQLFHYFQNSYLYQKLIVDIITIHGASVGDTSNGVFKQSDDFKLNF